jgi:4-amino-4-deoxy-L-arabinose transferase-like glycosyltransferase
MRLAVPLALIALAAAVRIASFAALPPERLVADEIYYAQVARNLALGEGHHYADAFGADLRAWRPPAHPWVLSKLLSKEQAAALEDRVQDAMPLLAFQIGLGSLLVGVVWWLGWSLFGARSATTAGLAAALYPNLIVFSHSLWSETLTALLIALALVGAARWRAAPSAGIAVATGIALGVAALTREVALAIALVIGAWWVVEAAITQRRRALLHALVVGGVALAVVAPWTARNARVLGSFVPVSTIGWFAAGEGNTFEQADWLADRGPAHLAYTMRYFSNPHELERAALARRWTFERFAAEQPAWAFRKLVREGALLLTPDSYLLYKIDAGAYGEISSGLRAVLAWIVGASWVALAVLAALGMAAAATTQRRLALFVLGVPAVVHFLTNASSRFRAPWLPLLLVFAGYAWQERHSLRQRISTRAGFGAAAFAGFVLLVALPYYLQYGTRH